MILKRINPLLLSFFLFFTLFDVNAFDEEEASVFASFIKGVSQTTQGGNKSGSSLCTFGKDEIVKAISSDRLVIDLNQAMEKLGECKTIYIANDKRRTVKLDLSKFNARRILTIATFDGFTEDGGILQVQMGRRNFELTLNGKLAKEFGIKLNSLVSELIIN